MEKATIIMRGHSLSESPKLDLHQFEQTMLFNGFPRTNFDPSISRHKYGATFHTFSNPTMIIC